MIDRAIEARRHAYADSSLRRFRAEVQGHVYFLGEFQGEREVIRADQIALNVRWEAPDRALQTIVGRRHEIRLPTQIRYHIDHLSLVLDNFGDRIQLGDGDEVWNVLHPAAAGARDFYEFRLTSDTLQIRIRDRTARVFELEVRPKDVQSPGVVGSVFVDFESGAIARMRLTFTSASYLDPELVRIVLDIKSALWEERYWLPVEQDLEITRSLSWFAFPVETVIRTRLDVLEYYLNEEPGLSLGAGQHVASLPDETLASFDRWESPLYGGPIEDHERSDSELELAKSSAQALVRQHGLVGGRRLQVSLPNASSGLRARRAEGLLVGAGAAYRIDDRTRLSLWGGYPIGVERPAASLELVRGIGSWELGIETWLRANRDVGRAAASGVIRTLALVTEGEDYEDPYFEDGGRVAIARQVGSTHVELGVSVRRQRTAELVVQTALVGSRPLRPVRPIDDGELIALDAAVGLILGEALGAAWTTELTVEGATGWLGSFGYTRATVVLEAISEGFASDWGWASELLIGASGGDLPAQRLFLLGGRGTLPGYDFRPWGGDRMGLWRGDLSRSIAAPWVRLRVLGAAGWTKLGGAGAGAAERFGVIETPAVRASAGVGLGLFYDLLRLDLVRGLSGTGTPEGEWSLLLSLDTLLWGVL